MLVDGGRPGQLDEMVGVLNECLREERLRIERASGCRVDERLQSRFDLGIGAIGENVEQAAEQIRGEMQVNLDRLIMKQGHAFKSAGDEVLAGQGKGRRLRRARRQQTFANELLLQVECRQHVGVGGFGSQERRATLELAKEFGGRRHNPGILVLAAPCRRRLRLADVRAWSAASRSARRKRSI